MDLLRYALEVIPTLIVILNPFGAALILVGLTQDDPPEALKHTVRVTTLTVILTLVIFAFLGQLIFKLYGITLDAFRIAGGVLLFGMGMSMLRGQHPQSRITEKERLEAAQREEIAIIPMAIPVLSGPGAIATVMVQRANLNTFSEILVLFAGILCAGIVTYFVLLYAHVLVNRFGKAALRLMGRIMGLLVVTIAVQFVLTGIGNVIRIWFPE